MLKIWLPLHGDLKNYGLDNVNISSSISYSTSGKTGSKSGIFDSVVDTTLSFDTSSSCAFGAWVKVEKSQIQTIADTKTFTATNSTLGGTLLGRDSYGGLALRWKTNDLSSTATVSSIEIYGHIRDAASNSVITSSYTIPSSNWVHIMLISNRDTQKMSFFVNGDLFSEVDISNVTGTFSAGNFLICQSSIDEGNKIASSGKWYFNDIRFYSTYISNKEVKELWKGLVLHYTLNDIYMGAIAHDASGYHYNGAKNGTLQFSTDTPRYSHSTVFSGTQYISIPDYPNLDYKFSISWWGNMTSWGDYAGALSCLNSASGGWSFDGGNSVVRFNAYQNQTGIIRVEDTDARSSLSAGWHHWVGTMDRGTMKLYRDGQLINTSTSSSTSKINYDSDTPLIIGGNSIGQTTKYSGSLSDIRIYASVLTADDVLELYHTAATIDKGSSIHAYEFVEGE